MSPLVAPGDFRDVILAVCHTCWEEDLDDDGLCPVCCDE